MTQVRGRFFVANLCPRLDSNGQKKEKNGGKILEISLRSSNPYSLAPEDQSDTSFVEDSEDSWIEMGSTSPKGEKKKRSMMEILRSSAPLDDSRLLQVTPGMIDVHPRLFSSSSSGKVSGNLAGCSNGRSRADEVEMVDNLANSISVNHFPNVVASDLPSNHASGSIMNTVSLNSPTGDLISDPLLVSDSGVPEKSHVEKSPVEKFDVTKIPTNQNHEINSAKSWVSLFADNRKPGSGMSLDFIPSEPNDTVSFNEDEWNSGAAMWKFLLIGQVLGLNVRFKAIENYVQKVWSHVPEVCLLKTRLFLFKFKSKEEVDDILSKGPWFFGSRPILLKPWNIGEDINKSEECIYPLWIQLPALRLNLWNSKSLSKIASVIGKPIAIDKLTANKQRLAYARILVEVKMPSPLPEKITIQSPNGISYNQVVHYEFKPRWCNWCKLVGHDTDFCKKHQRVQHWVPKQKVDAGKIDTRSSELIPDSIVQVEGCNTVLESIHNDVHLL